MKADGPEEHAFDARSLPAAIKAGPEGELVWQPLKSAWLTHHFVSDRGAHQGGGYKWDTSRYLPVLTLNEEGEPILGFARRSG